MPGDQTVWIIDLNDTAVSIHDERGLRAASAGYAILDDEIVTGEAALARSRTQPRLANNTFWQRLSQEELPRTARRARTPADLAHAHLLALVAQAAGEERPVATRDALLMVPASMDRTQMGLLLGITRQCPLRVTALVERSVAALAALPVRLPCIHVDQFLHHALLTVVGTGVGSAGAAADGEVLQVLRAVEVPELGHARLADAFVHAIAARFVRETRFDPLHQAATEQRLFDRLGVYLRGLLQADEVVVESAHAGQSHSVSLTRRALADAAQPHYGALALALADLQREYRAACIAVTERVRLLPGLDDQLRDLDCHVETLDDHASGRGGFAAATAVPAGTRGTAYVNRLPRRRTGAPAPGDARPLPSVAVAATHLLAGNVLHALDDRALSAGFGAPRGGRWLRLDVAGNHGGNDGTVAFSAVRTAGRTLLLPEPAAAVLVNGRPVTSHVPLAVGDEITVAGAAPPLRVVGLAEPG
jgi:hypothetical protein